MNLFVWFRARLLGPHDQMKTIVVEEIEHQVSKLNGATENLSHGVRVIQNDRAQSRRAFTDMLDSATREHKKDSPR